MVYACAVVGCTNRNNRERHLSYFCIPKVITNQCQRTLTLSKSRRALWLSRISRKDLEDKDVTANTRVCSVHFHTGKPANLFESNNPDWAPSLKMKPEQKPKPVVDPARSQRAEERGRRILGQLQAEEEHRIDVEEEVEQLEEVVDVAALQESLRQLTILSDTLQERNVDLERKLARCEEENHLLKKQFMFNEEYMEKDNERVHFYTGLPSFEILKHVFELCKDDVQSTHRNAMSQFQELMMVLMRLRLNLLEEDLARRFIVSQPTVSRVLTKWLEVLSLKLRGLLIWPERDTLIKTMPECFKKAFGSSVALIIDCFEVFCERPSNLLARAGTWSNYKHHNTVKFLIGITPQGTICYISQAYPGRMPDSEITEHSKIIDRLTPGDAIISDRGFNIQGAQVLRVQVIQPAYVYGRPQLSGEEVDSTRKIANVRIHVERLIGLVRRKYRILSELLPTDSMKIKQDQYDAPIDQIAVICCALCNLCPPIVPMFDKED